MCFTPFAEHHVFFHCSNCHCLWRKNEKIVFFLNSHNKIPSDLQSYQCPHWLIALSLKVKWTQKFCCLLFLASIASRIGCLFAVYLWRSSSISLSIIGSKAFNLICNSSKLRFFNCKKDKTSKQKKHRKRLQTIYKQYENHCFS